MRQRNKKRHTESTRLLTSFVRQQQHVCVVCRVWYAAQKLNCFGNPTMYLRTWHFYVVLTFTYNKVLFFLRQQKQDLYEFTAWSRVPSLSWGGRLLLSWLNSVSKSKPYRIFSSRSDKSALTGTWSTHGSRRGKYHMLSATHRDVTCAVHKQKTSYIKRTNY